MRKELKGAWSIMHAVPLRQECVRSLCCIWHGCQSSHVCDAAVCLKWSFVENEEKDAAVGCTAKTARVVIIFFLAQWVVVLNQVPL